ncbi:hypothetical protein [Coprobacter sp.]
MKNKQIYIVLFFLLGGVLLVHDKVKGENTNEPPATYLQRKLDKSQHFRKYVNHNGIISYVLQTHLAKYQLSMYYTNPSVTDDGRYIWFWLSDSRGNFTVALFDVEKDEIRQYKKMKIASSSSYVDVKTGEVYWVKPSSGQRFIGDFYDVLKRGPLPSDKITRVAGIPHFVDDASGPRQVVTHLSPTADRSGFAFDSGNYPTNNKTYIGTVSIDGQKPKLWTVLDRRYNHAQMHPVHNDVMLIAQDYFKDQTGQYGAPNIRVPIDNRMWIVYADGSANPVFPKPNNIYHEWWDASGKYLWYIDKSGNRGGKGVCRVTYNYKERSFGEPELVWADALSHASSSKSGNYLVADHGYKQWEKTDSVRVSFFNMETGREIDIVSKLPYSGVQNHPHPHFAVNDEIICYTFSEPGSNTFALTFTRPLIYASDKVR